MMVWSKCSPCPSGCQVHTCTSFQNTGPVLKLHVPKTYCTSTTVAWSCRLSSASAIGHALKNKITKAIYIYTTYIVAIAQGVFSASSLKHPEEHPAIKGEPLWKPSGNRYTFQTLHQNLCVSQPMWRLPTSFRSVGRLPTSAARFKASAPSAPTAAPWQPSASAARRRR